MGGFFVVVCLSGVYVVDIQQRFVKTLIDDQMFIVN